MTKTMKTKVGGSKDDKMQKSSKKKADSAKGKAKQGKGAMKEKASKFTMNTMF